MISQRLWGGLGGDASEGGRAESKGCDRRAGGGVRQERLGEATVKPVWSLPLKWGQTYCIRL